MKLKSQGLILVSLSSVICFVFYLLNVDSGLHSTTIALWVNMLLMSTTLVLLLGRKEEKAFLFALYITSIFVIFWALLRFQGFFGTDVWGELNVAEYTFENGWSHGLVANTMYGTCTSITIFPSIFSHVTGISMDNVFLFVFPAITALLPIMLYLLIKNVTGSMAVAGLSSIIFIFDYTSLTTLSNVIRENVAELFLITTLFLVYKRLDHSKLSARLATILCLAIVGTIISHYTTTAFLLFILFSSTMIAFLKKSWKSSHFVSSNLTFFALVATLAWTSFVAYIIFSLSIDATYDTILRILAGTGTAHPYAQYAITSPRGGIFSTAITDAYRFLIFLGAVICLKKYKDFKTRTFTFQGILMLLLLLSWIAIPHISRIVYLDRVFSLGLLFYCFFIASSLLVISSLGNRLLLKLGKVLTNRKRINFNFNYAIIGLIVFVFFFNHVRMMPTFYYMPMSRASPTEIISAPFRGKTDMAFNKWLESYSQTNAPFVGDLRSLETVLYSAGRFGAPLANALLYSYFNIDNLPVGQSEFQYIIVMDYTFKSNLIVERHIGQLPNVTITEFPSGRVVIHYDVLPLEYAFTSKPGANIIYNNARNLVVASEYGWNPLSES